MTFVVKTARQTSSAPSKAFVRCRVGFGRLFTLTMVFGTSLAIALLTNHAFGQEYGQATERIGDAPAVQSTQVETTNYPPIIQAPASYPSDSTQQPPLGIAGEASCAQCEEQPAAAKPKVDPCKTSHKPVFFLTTISATSKKPTITGNAWEIR